jgi:hypothetical protein
VGVDLDTRVCEAVNPSVRCESAVREMIAIEKVAREGRLGAK